MTHDTNGNNSIYNSHIQINTCMFQNKGCINRTQTLHWYTVYPPWVLKACTLAMPMIIQMVHTILQYNIPCLLYLLMKYSKNCKWTRWTSQVSSYVPYIFEEDRPGNYVGQGLSNILHYVMSYVAIILLEEQISFLLQEYVWVV